MKLSCTSSRQDTCLTIFKEEVSFIKGIKPARTFSYSVWFISRKEFFVSTSRMFVLFWTTHNFVGQHFNFVLHWVFLKRLGTHPLLYHQGVGERIKGGRAGCLAHTLRAFGAYSGNHDLFDLGRELWFILLDYGFALRRESPFTWTDDNSIR